MFRSTPLALLLLCGSLAVAACAPEQPAEIPDTTPEEASIPFDKEGTLDFLQNGEPVVTIDLEIAETDSARQRGMMQRTSIPENGGMLFPFPYEGPQSFWMANTPLSLDLFFANADSQIVHIAKYAKPFSPQSVASPVPAQYVVETRAGFADTHGILEGDRIRWRRDDGE